MTLLQLYAEESISLISINSIYWDTESESNLEENYIKKRGAFPRTLQSA